MLVPVNTGKQKHTNIKQMNTKTTSGLALMKLYPIMLLLLFSLLALLTISGCHILPLSDSKDQPETNKYEIVSSSNEEANREKQDSHQTKDKSKKEAGQTEIDETAELTISAVGDIMVHSPQLNAQYDPESNAYDFSDNFKYITPHMGPSDLVLGNLETVLAGEEQGFTGFPLFNSPDALAEALKDAGFQVLSTANNHSIDRGEQGLKRTLDVIEDHGMEAIGTRKTTDENSYLIKEVEGVHIGLSAYTYETPRHNGQRTINGIPMSEEVGQLLDSFNPNELDKDMTKMVERVKEMQEEGAELIVFFMHWGQEYQRYPDVFQEKIAKELVENGVDIIFGSHPHVIQPVDEIRTDSGKRGIVINSMGNFISNQRSEYLNSPYTEDGIIFHVDVLRENDKSISVEAVRYTPTWVHRFQANGGLNYHILPLPHALENKDKYGLENPANINKAERAWENTRSILKEGSYEPKLEENW